MAFKASGDVEQLSSRIGKIELQLLNDFVVDSEKRREEIFNNIINTNSDIVAVHMPLCKNGKEIELQDFANYNNKEMISNVFGLANDIGERTDRRICIVIHNAYNTTNFYRDEALFLSITSFLSTLLSKNPLVDIAIENIIPMTIERKGDSNVIAGRGGWDFDVVDVVAMLKCNSVMDDRVFSVLDTCHAIVSDRIITEIFGPDAMDLSLDKFIERYAASIKVIHLANVIKYGMVKGEHGCTFDLNKESDWMLLESILTKIEECLDGKEFILTLEVDEVDYNKAANAEALYHYIASREI